MVRNHLVVSGEELLWVACWDLFLGGGAVTVVMVVTAEDWVTDGEGEDGETDGGEVGTVTDTGKSGVCACAKGGSIFVCARVLHVCWADELLYSEVLSMFSATKGPVIQRIQEQNAQFVGTAIRTGRPSTIVCVHKMERCS